MTDAKTPTATDREAAAGELGAAGELLVLLARNGVDCWSVIRHIEAALTALGEDERAGRLYGDAVVAGGMR